jgi:hypothetical protein
MRRSLSLSLNSFHLFKSTKEYYIWRGYEKADIAQLYMSY